MPIARMVVFADVRALTKFSVFVVSSHLVAMEPSLCGT